jgi:hypothetical protein
MTKLLVAGVFLAAAAAAVFAAFYYMTVVPGRPHSGPLPPATDEEITAAALQFVRWLAKEHPQGRWEQFLTDDGQELRWDKVFIAGSSHGATTAARLRAWERCSLAVSTSTPSSVMRLARWARTLAFCISERVGEASTSKRSSTFVALVFTC